MRHPHQPGACCSAARRATQGLAAAGAAVINWRCMTVPMGIFSREAYRDWCAQQPRGRFERVEGRIVPMARERIGHVRMRAVYMRRCTAR